MIEKILSQHMCNNEQLAALIATFDDEPAVFHQIAPQDTDDAWDDSNGPIQFSRIVFDYDKSGDVERKISGILYIDVMCSDQSIGSPEAIEAVLKDIIDGYFFVDEGVTFAAKWESTDSFKTEPNNKVFGLTLNFSLLAFPLQNTIEPDTVALMNSWSQRFFPNATIINVSKTEPVFKPTDEKPAIYWSFQGLSESPIPSIHFCTWIQSNLNMHVIAPSEIVRTSIVTAAVHELAEKTRVLFPDKSQYMIHRVLMNLSADPIRVGQLTVQGSYAIVPQSSGTPLANIHNTY